MHSIFARNENGEVLHTYSTYHRGDSLRMGAFIAREPNDRLARYLTFLPSQST